MSYSHLLTSSQRPVYETLSTYPPQQFSSTGVFPTSSSNPGTSIALFHIPKDATNSLYVDGIPNDASEREVSRRYIIIEISFALFQVSNASASSRKALQQVESICCVLLIFRTSFSQQ